MPLSDPPHSRSPPMHPRAIAAAFLAAALLALRQPGLAAQERTRDFPAQKCRYTLPEGWDWAGAGTCPLPVPLPNPRQADWAELVAAFQQGLYRPGYLKKRGGHFLTFQGLPAFQAEGTLANGRTAAGRFVIGHGLSYALLVVGGEAPVEREPDFEAVMGGFAFTEPPAPSPRIGGRNPTCRTGGWRSTSRGWWGGWPSGACWSWPRWCGCVGASDGRSRRRGTQLAPRRPLLRGRPIKSWRVPWAGRLSRFCRPRAVPCPGPRAPGDAGAPHVGYTCGMCGRFLLFSDGATLAGLFDLAGLPELAPR
jgi:hypothetical protein